MSFGQTQSISAYFSSIKAGFGNMHICEANKISVKTHLLCEALLQCFNCLLTFRLDTFASNIVKHSKSISPMKKTAFSVLSVLLVAAALLMASCREGGAEQSATEQPLQDTTQTVQETLAAPVDTLATELDEATNEIEQDARDLQSALDSL
jgi:hypothetical protein